MASNRSVIEYLESAVYGGRRDPMAVCTRAGLAVCALLYGSSIRAYLLPFRTGLRARNKLSRPVISVGNITVGGTGKSPTVQFICRGLIARGWKPTALSYGYRSQLHGQMGIVSDSSGIKLSAKEAGDEPVMLASSLAGVPVVVGKHRHVTGRIAIRDLGADVIVLDDGFQVWKLHRDLDIVLINAGNPFDNGRVLPAGKLREPLDALSRADCIIATGEWVAESRDGMLAEVRKHTHSPVFFGRFDPSAVVSLADGSQSPVESLAGRNVFALSSIARPAAFEATLASTGASICGREHFPDHHQYRTEDIDLINQSAAECGAEAIITTDKDAAKLVEHKMALPAMSLRIRLHMDDEPGFWLFVDSKVGNADGENTECV